MVFFPGLYRRDSVVVVVVSLRWLLLVQSVGGGMTDHNSLGDYRGSVNNGGDGLGVDHSSMNNRGVSEGDWSDDRAGAMAKGITGITSGCGEGDSQDGSEDSLWRRLLRRFKVLAEIIPSNDL